MTTKVMISVPQDFLQELDELARKEHRSRSELVREAVRFYKKKTQARPIDDPAVQEAYDYILSVSEKWTGPGDMAAVVRNMRDTRQGR